ncbi:Uncharacterized protein TCM_006410 [Theobroma cacao]|uniref:Phytocyanin domain-containing protein n=1 Tax=Theobroma cacao TaxID=3641 RepID=A0A061DXD6_THECC|nr:Uncharacterized protein TCM_006410 [Theobroma cacao]
MAQPRVFEIIAKGWSFNVENWNGKKFLPDDVLIFNYDPAIHNVISVNQVSYDTCTLGSNFKAYQSGHDQIVLAKG